MYRLLLVLLVAGLAPIPHGTAEARPDAPGVARGEARRTVERAAEPGTAEAAPDPEPERPAGPQSIGRASRGRLAHGMLLEPTAQLRYRSGGPELRWGTRELVSLLRRAAVRVARRLPGAEMVVGDLSRQRGGRMAPHRSHRNGRDVDIAFYMTDAAGAPAYRDRFVRFGPDGMSRAGVTGLRFDVARNWELVRALISDPRASVQYIFVYRHLRKLLLEEGVRRGASAEELERAAIAMEQPRRGGRHDDHFHVRIYCASDDRPRCVDLPPFRPWYQPHSEALPSPVVAHAATSAGR